jgi:gliding motility-associated-like protein
MTPVTNACACNGSISFSPADATPTNYLLVSLTNGSNYLHSTSNGFVQNGLCGGTYMLEATASGVTNTLYITVLSNNNDIPAHTQLAQCNNSPNFDLEASLANLPAGGTWYDPSGNPTTANQNPSIATEGFYAYAASISGCPITTGVLVEINDLPVTGNQTTTLVCDSWLPFEMLFYMQGAPDPGGQWYNAQGVPMNGYFDPATMSSALFTYIIDDVPGCAPVYTTMYVQENTTPDPGLPSDVLVCENGTPFNMFNYIEGSPTAGGIWRNPFNQIVSGTFTPGVSFPGTYTYTIDALTPCVDQNVTLTIAATPNDPSGESIQLNLCSNTPGFDLFDELAGTPTPGGTWTTANGTSFDGNFSVQGTGAGTFFYYYPNVGCNPVGAQVDITIEPLLNAGNNYSGTICSNAGSLNLSSLLSSGASSSGTWYNSASQIINPTIALNPSAEQLYAYFIDGTVCPDDYAFFDIFVDIAPPSLNSTSLSICENEPALDLGQIYSAYPSVGFFDTAGIAISPIFDPSLGMDLNAIVQLPSGNICPASESNISIAIENLITLETITETICENTEVIDLSVFAPSFSSTSGIWYTAAGLATPIVGPWNSTLTEYYFVPNNVQFCPIDTGYLNLNISAFVASETLDNESFCELDPIFSLTDFIPSNWSDNGEWTLNNLPISVAVDPFIAQDGDYIYTIPGQGSCPEASLTLPIDIVSPPVFDLGPDQSFCASQNTVALGTANSTYDFNWSPGNFLSDPTIASPILSANPDSSQITVLQYEVSISNVVCTVYDTLNITFYPLPTIDLEDAYSICLGESISLSLPAIYTCDWSPAFNFTDPTSNTQLIQPLDTTQIHVEVVNNWNCTSEKDLSINVIQNPNFIVLSNPKSACYVILDTLRTIGDGSYTYEWMIGDLWYSGDSLALELYVANNYDVTVVATNEHGCQTEQILPQQYTLHPSPTSIFETFAGDITTVNNTVNTINLTTTANLFEWTLDGMPLSNDYEPEIILPGTEERNFEICQIATNSFGCQDTSCRWVHMENEYLLWAPNAFTPDNDHINDVFSISMMGFDESIYELIILDRWGLEVFRSKDPKEVWVGDHQNGTHYCQPDIYSWVLTVKKKDSAEFESIKGHITLIR